MIPVKKSLVIVYLSTSGNTKKMADAIAAGADSRGIDVTVESFYDADMDLIRKADCHRAWLVHLLVQNA